MSRASEFVVSEAVVRGLVDAFLAGRKGRAGRYCVTFRQRQDELRAALASLPAVDGWIDHGAASRVLDGFVCHKLAANCNSWTPFMRLRLREAKVARAARPPEEPK